MAKVAEIGPAICRLSLFVSEFDLQFNHFLVGDVVEEFRRAKQKGPQAPELCLTFAHGAMWMSIALTCKADTDTTTLLVRPLAAETTPAKRKKG